MNGAVNRKSRIRAIRAQALVGLLLAVSCSQVLGQEPRKERFVGESKWKLLASVEGVEFRYLYYKAADGVNAGLVMMLENTNDYAVSLTVKVVFRSDDAEVEQPLEQTLDPGQLKTGDRERLFWVPWEDGRAITQVGLRGYKVQRLAPNRASQNRLQNDLQSAHEGRLGWIKSDRTLYV